MDELYFSYGLAISHDYKKHQHVMELLEWGKKHDKINYGICEFIISRKWDELEKLKESGKYENMVADSEMIYDML